MKAMLRRLLKILLLTGSTILMLFTLSVPAGAPPLIQELTDTSEINRLNRQAWSDSRRDPDFALAIGYRTLAASGGLGYTGGIADASLAVGNAYLAKFMVADSAYQYYMNAYELYRETGNNRGKARACYGLAYVFSIGGNYNESERYAALSLSFFEQAGDSRGMVNAYHVLSYLARQQKDLQKSRALIEQAISIAKEVRDTVTLADVTNTLGIIYMEMALFRRAIDTYFEALQLWEALGDSAGMGIAYGSIGLMYYYQKDWTKALEFNNRKVPISKALGDLWELSKTFNNIAQIYNSMNKHDTALIYLVKSLEINNQMKYQAGIAEALHKMATTWLLMGRPDSAYISMTMAIGISDQINNPLVGEYYVTMSSIYKATGDYPNALKYASQAYQLGKERDLPLVVSDASGLLGDIYGKTGRKDLAYDFLLEYHKLSDSISNNDYLKQVTRLELEYEYDKKQKAAEFAQMRERIKSDLKITQQRTYLKGLIMLMVLVIIISFLYLRHNKLRAMIAGIELEQKLLRARMNPHFISNSLCAVQDLILAGKTDEADNFLSKISKLMRNILEDSGEEFIPLDREIDTLRLYLDVQKLRFEKSFEYHIAVNESIDTGNVSIPPMLTQPIVENSIEHGLMNIKELGRISIGFELNDNLMSIEVTDNGAGRDMASAISDSRRKKESLSTRLTNQRFAHFRRIFREKSIGFEITDLKSEGKATGTKVSMIVPCRSIYN